MQTTAQGTSQGGSGNAGALTSQQQAELEQLKAFMNQLKDRPAQSEAELAMQERELYVQHKQETMAGIGGALLLFPIVVAVAVGIVRRGRGSPVVHAPLDDGRFLRLEQAVDAIAVEIERIGEAQRFQTKLMSEKIPARELRSPSRVPTPV